MLKTVEKVLFLQDLEMFRVVSTEHLARLALVARDSELHGGRVLFSKGQPAAQLHLLVEGQVRLEDEPGKGIEVEKTCLDFWSVFSENPHSFSAQTVGNCTLLTVPYDDLVDLLTAESEFCWAILKFFARLGNHMQTKIQKLNQD